MKFRKREERKDHERINKTVKNSRQFFVENPCIVNLGTICNVKLLKKKERETFISDFFSFEWPSLKNCGTFKNWIKRLADAARSGIYKPKFWKKKFPIAIYEISINDFYLNPIEEIQPIWKFQWLLFTSKKDCPNILITNRPIFFI